MMQFEDISFKNLIYIHREALKKVNNGYLVTELFSSRERSSLKRHGILVRETKTGFPGWRCILTQKAIDTLESEGG